MSLLSAAFIHRLHQAALFRDCRECRRKLPVESFALNPTCRGGRLPLCRKCDNRRRRAQYYLRGGHEDPPTPTSRPDAQIVPPGWKWCRKCNKLVGRRAFTRSSMAADRKQGWCKACFRAYRQARDLEREGKGPASRAWKWGASKEAHQREQRPEALVRQWADGNYIDPPVDHYIPRRPRHEFQRGEVAAMRAAVSAAIGLQPRPIGVCPVRLLESLYPEVL